MNEGTNHLHRFGHGCALLPWTQKLFNKKHNLSIICKKRTFIFSEVLFAQGGSAVGIDPMLATGEQDYLPILELGKL